MLGPDGVQPRRRVIEEVVTECGRWITTRADLLQRLGRSSDAVAAYDAVLALTGNDAERRFLQHRRLLAR